MDIWCCSDNDDDDVGGRILCVFDGNDSLRFEFADVVVVVVVVVDVVDDDWDKYIRLFCEAKNDCNESKLTLLKLTKLIGWIRLVLFCTSVLELFCTNGCVVVWITVLKFGVIFDWFPWTVCSL